jgi:hypothetical protein
VAVVVVVVKLEVDVALSFRSSLRLFRGGCIGIASVSSALFLLNLPLFQVALTMQA